MRRIHDRTSRLFKITIYQSLILYLIILMTIGIYNIGLSLVYKQIIIALLTSILLELSIIRLRFKKFIFPYSAVITGLFIGMILNPETSLYLPFLASILAILSKHLIKIKNTHIFNPAVFGLLLIGLFFSGYSNWWGFSSTIAVIILGTLILLQIRRFNMILSYYLSFVILQSIISQNIISSLFVVNLSFMVFMIIEPRTSPNTQKGKIIFGIITGILNVLFLTLPIGIGSEFPALLIANISRLFYRNI